MTSRTAKRDLGTQDDVALHARTAQIDVAIFEPRVFGDISGFVHGEWRREGRIENPDAVGDDFDFAGCEVGVDVLLRALRDVAFDGDDVFGADLFSALVDSLGDAGLEDDLGDAVAVAQIGEDHGAMVAAPMNPSHQEGALAGVGGA